MTDIQKRKITAMRGAGMGYRSIADKLGISRDRVRYFCKTAGLDGKVSSIKSDFVFCEHCGEELKQPMRGRRRRFCSDDCRRTWWVQHPEAKIPNMSAVYKIICSGCGVLFESYGNMNRRYCTHNCYIKTKFKTEVQS